MHTETKSEAINSWCGHGSIEKKLSAERLGTNFLLIFSELKAAVIGNEPQSVIKVRESKIVAARAGMTRFCLNKVNALELRPFPRVSVRVPHSVVAEPVGIVSGRHLDNGSDNTCERRPQDDM